jgi:hypothetical protein
MFELSRKRRSKVSQNELIILIVVLIAWGVRDGSHSSPLNAPKLRANLGA